MQFGNITHWKVPRVKRRRVPYARLQFRMVALEPFDEPSHERAQGVQVEGRAAGAANVRYTSVFNAFGYLPSIISILLLLYVNQPAGDRHWTT